MSDGVIRAAGGVVVRDDSTGMEIVVVHRPKYDDWTLPKGKAERGESDEECALREVEEETGLRCELLEELASVSYNDAAGPAEDRPLLADAAGRRRRSEPRTEIDDARWVPLAEAGEQLTYERDRDDARCAVPGCLPPA